MNAQDFRERMGEQISKNRQTESKNGQFNSSWLDEIYNPITNQTWGEIMNQNIKIKEMPGLDLVYLTHMGQFNQIGNAYNRLMQWAGPRGLLSDPEVKTVTVYHDDPSVTDIEKVRQSACITVKVDVKPDGEFGKMSIEGGKHVVGRFEIDETQFEQAWNSVCLWMSESGYQPGDGLPYELYHKDPQDHPERKFLLDICIPVKPL
jgi:AraC family transcriptional regulator